MELAMETLERNEVFDSERRIGERNDRLESVRRSGDRGSGERMVVGGASAELLDADHAPVFIML